MSLHIADVGTVLAAPQLDDAGATAAEEVLIVRREAERLYPVAMGLTERRDRLCRGQVPLLDAGVARPGQQRLVIERQRLDPVVMRRLQLHRRRDQPDGARRHVEHLDVVILERSSPSQYRCRQANVCLPSTP